VFYRGSTPRWREVDSTSILNSATLPSLPLLAQPMASFWIALSQANFFFFFGPRRNKGVSFPCTSERRRVHVMTSFLCCLRLL
jgi:hypothetical protein